MTSTPRIYVASLSDYNNGNLHGAWIDVDQSAEEIHAEIKAMLAKGAPGAEEYAIHDFEMPGGIRLSEWASIDRVAAFGQAWSEAGDNGDAFAAWYSNLDEGSIGDDDADDLHARFQDAYMGSADTFKDWITSNDTDVLGLDNLEAFVKDAERSHFGPKVYSELLEKVTQYIDWDMVARDQAHDYDVVSVGGTTYVFIPE